MTDFFTLGIESSCDETSAAILNHNQVVSLVTATQEVHEKFGGVVPELASRAHQSNIIPVIDQAIKSSGLNPHDLNGIAVTQGPGLMGSLHVGVALAKSLALAWEKPLVGVNHMHAHVLAHCIDKNLKDNDMFPMLCLTVSGGHTQLVLVHSPFHLELVGSTIDDAAGEALDKAAKLIGLPYPGGPHLDAKSKVGDKSKFSFSLPHPMGLNYSFSGLKTSLLYFLRDQSKVNENFIEEFQDDIAASYQNAVVKYLLRVFKKALEKYPVRCIGLAGGVSANSQLRAEFTQLGTELGIQTCIPPLSYCTDNAAMVGMAGYFLLQQPIAKGNLIPNARLPF